MESPAPRHVRNWRGILTELAIVVLGVGLALAAQQAAEWLRWRNDVAQAREFLATELARNVRQGIWRMRTSGCAERRLDELGAILDGAAKTGAICAPLGKVPLHYGEGLFGATAPLMDDAVKAIPDYARGAK